MLEAISKLFSSAKETFICVTGITCPIWNEFFQAMNTFLTFVVTFITLIYIFNKLKNEIKIGKKLKAELKEKHIED